MGFSVTATFVVFFVALLGAAGVAASAFWKTADLLHESRDTESSRAEELVHTNLTIASAPTYDGGTNTLTFTVQNTGATVLDVSDFAFLVDGVVNLSLVSESINGNTNTDVFLPGESMIVTLSPITSAPTHVQAVAGNGVSARWG